MKSLAFFLLSWLIIPAQQDKKSGFGIVIHGGAGNITKEFFKDESAKKLYENALQTALDSGYHILERGGTALDAVTKAIEIMEDCPLFNAGRGSVWTSEGIVEMDASVMEGKELKAGAVCGIRRIRNPIRAARWVMEKTPHVFIRGDEMELLWVKNGGTLTPNAWFIDSTRWMEWKKKIHKKFGTVGAVALDKYGNLAAGTSTGGMQDKMPGRIGDSPVIGAGTYADNSTCAISCTGHGEMFIRLHVASRISDLMAYKKLSLEKAVQQVLYQDLPKIKGEGGIIGIDRNGNMVMDFNTSGMFRGYKHSSKGNAVLFFKP